MDDRKYWADCFTSVATCILHYHRVAQWLSLVNHLPEVVMPT